MRIGDLLVEQGLVSRAELERTLAGSRERGERIVSLLIATGQVTFDDGARCLGARHQIACALERHLGHRDSALAARLPGELARSVCALPIGVNSSGALIVCVRDPDPALSDRIAAAVRGPVVLAVAPASRLARLVEEAYGPSPVDEFDINVDTGLIPKAPPLPDMDALDPASVRQALTALDDDRVAKQPAKSYLPRPSGKDSRPLPVMSGKRVTVEATRRALAGARDRDDATAITLGFLGARWTHALLLAIRGGHAVALRSLDPRTGHAPGFELPLEEVSTVQHAIEEATTSNERFPGLAQESLCAALDSEHVTAAPVIVDHEVIAAIAVGDPVFDPEHDHAFDAHAASADLAAVASALGDTYQRVGRK